MLSIRIKAAPMDACLEHRKRAILTMTSETSEA